MSSCWIVLAVLSAPLDDVAVANVPESGRAARRPIPEVTREVDEAMRVVGRATEPAERSRAAWRLIELYREIRHDSRLVVSEPLQRAKRRLAGRLKVLQREVQDDLRRQGRGGEWLTDEELLAWADQEWVTDSLAEHWLVAGDWLGGGAGLVGRALAQPSGAGGAAGPPDYGPALVELIQRTLVPEFWDVNGGPGTIFYFRPLMCLVVRATSDVHHRLGGFRAKLTP